MTISRIARLRNCGVFRDFSWPADLLDFARYNVIYGWNGSGKTTISKVLRALEMRTAPARGEATLTIDGREVGGAAFAQQAILIRVFNRDFVTESVFPVGGGAVSPIFVVGKEGVSKQKEVEAVRARMVEASQRLTSSRDKTRLSERELDNFCIARAQVIRDSLRSSGTNLFNTFHKGDFRTRAEDMAREGNAAAHRLIDLDRENMFTRARANSRPKLQTLTAQPPALGPIVSAASELMSKTVVSAAIDALRDDAELAAWIREGLHLHHDRSSERCLFCEQPLQRERVEALEAHFSAAYERFLTMLDAQVLQVRAASQIVASVVPPNRGELYDDLAAEYDAARSALLEGLRATSAFLDSVAQALTEKKTHPFEKMTLELAAVPDAVGAEVDRLNASVRQHNRACDEFQARVTEARDSLATDFIARDLEQYSLLRQTVEATSDAERQAAAEVKQLKLDVERLERQIIEHRQPAEELNADLHKYLGHNELQLETKETGYTIMRDGSPAEALSEGEMTAIALLYFLKSLKDRRFDISNGVVVLDDPVSSLDANALYLAFGFIRQRCHGAGQLLILTHNFTLFRQVRNWFHNIKGQRRSDAARRPARLYMLECAHDGTRRCSAIRALDPLLEEYESEYHYLFARVYREATAATKAGLEQNYVLPNMARRLLEAFLAFRRPQVSGELWQKLEDVKFDETKKLRIIRFVQTYSHGDTIEEPEHDPFSLGEARAVLADLLALLEEEDPEHFAAMVRLVTPSRDERNEA